MKQRPVAKPLEEFDRDFLAVYFAECKRFKHMKEGKRRKKILTLRDLLESA
jgi:hypothetical protein